MGLLEMSNEELLTQDGTYMTNIARISKSTVR